MTWDEEDELSRAVCSLLETPPTITARKARKKTPGFVWVNYHDYESPGGWWVANIGTDHGPESADDDPVEWVPARELLSVIGNAWRLVEEMMRRGWLLHILACVDGWIVNGRRYELANGRWNRMAMPTSDMVQENGDEVGEAIGKAVIAALKPKPVEA